MADFVQKNVTKTAQRKLANKIPDIAALNALKTSLLGASNPLGVTSYTVAGVTKPGIEMTRERYGLKFIGADAEDKKVSTLTQTINDQSKITSAETHITGSADIKDDMGAVTLIHDSGNDSYSMTFKCHDPNGELYTLSISRTAVSISSFSDDAIKTTVDAWADTQTSLN